MYIGIAGTIGAGKTEFTKALATKLNFEPVFEPVDENLFLKDFYHDKARWGLHSQLTFLVHKILKQRDLKELLKHTNCIQDRLIFEDFMFARMLHEAGFMDKRSHDLYHKVVALCAEDVYYPDLVIFLDVSPETALTRIAARARGGENLIDAGYLQTLGREYRALVDGLERDGRPVLRLDWNKHRSLDRLLSRQTLFTIQERLL